MAATKGIALERGVETRFMDLVEAVTAGRRALETAPEMNLALASASGEP